MGSSHIAQGDQLDACDHLDGWDSEGGGEMQEGGDVGIYVYAFLMHFVIQQKLTHHCKAILPQ